MKRMNRYARLYVKHMWHTILFAVIFAAIITTTAFNSMETFIKYQVSNSLYSVASSIHSLYTEYEFCNDDHLKHVEILMNGYKENLDIDTAIYMDGKELLSTTNIKNDVDDNYANKELIEDLKRDGISIKGDANVNGNGYYSCTVALYDDEGEYIGAIFVGKEVDLITTTLRGRQMIYIAYMWTVSIMYILCIGISGTRRYAKCVELEKEIIVEQCKNK